MGGFGSEHPGFVIVGMADGSVSAVAFDVSPTLLRQLGDRADGELPSRD